tara:strand:+ start:19171 stop:19962 length:792 start_codon:yes stop_codon:yes gene_type:complete
MISVVITVYNKEKYIRSTINSVLSQIIQPTEVIIINDGSTDNSLRIINKLNLPKTYKVITKKNGGVSSARNLGLSLVTNNYVIFLDGDDIFLKNCILHFNKLIKRNPNYTLYAANRINKKGEKKIKKIKTSKFNYNLYFEYIISSNNLCWTSAVLINIQKGSNILFNESYSHGEDRDYFIQLLKKGDGFWSSEVVSKYIHDEEGLSSIPISKKEDLFFLNFIYYIKNKRKTYSILKYKLKYIFFNILNNFKNKKFSNIVSWLH